MVHRIQRYVVTAAAVALVLAAAAACGATGWPGSAGGVTPGSSEAGSTSGLSPSAASHVDPESIPAERRAWAYIDGKRYVVDIDHARSLGLTVVDLSDDWAPYIFWPQTPGQEDYKPNAYLDTYVDLANDRINLDGAELKPEARNYLEVYGIPPTLSVLRRRFIDDAREPCFQALDLELFREYHGSVRAVDPQSSKRLWKRYADARGAYRKALRVAGDRTLEALLARPEHAQVAERYRQYRWRTRALLAMKKRLVCERMYDKRPPRLPVGQVNWLVRSALRRFERKHNVYGWGMIFGETAAALGRTPLENNHASLRRVIIERVVSATGIVEDGSSDAEYRTADGSIRRVRDLVTELGESAIQQLGLTSAEEADRFMRAHSEQDFAQMLVALRLPPLPEYYNQHPMEISAVIDRGDIWYELPFKESGKPVPQPRSKLPTFTLYVHHNGQQIPLVNWRTTIGGWQKEKRGDQEYFKYKVSDIGPRIWKHIIAGPVWVPPAAAPSVELVKIRAMPRPQRVVSQSTFGPGYASAYGLVAAYHIEEDGFDNQIRTHGTVNYMSVKKGFSHGCHRLRNYNAVRLFSYLLRHREFTRRGQVPLAYTQRFEHRGEEFQINLDTRGYFYELTPPVKIEVLEGRIRGGLKDPLEEYVKKPSQVYQEDLPARQSKPQGPTGAPRTGSGKTNHPMRQQQTL